MNIGADQLQSAISYLIAFILSVAVHEFGHAWMANRLGDPTPRLQGRLTLAPQHHIDPIGTILMPIIMAVSNVPLLAWGRPVQYNPAALTRRYSVGTGRMMIAVAGPAMNLIMAFAVSIVIVVGAKFHAPDRLINAIFKYMVRLNISLMIFNLLPIPPLDGGAVLAWLLPRSMHNVVDFLARYGGFILLLMVVSPSMGLPLMGIIAYPIDLITSYWRDGLIMVIGS